MNTSKLLVLILCLVTGCLLSCGKQEAGSELLDMGVSDTGTIYQVPIQSCVDAASVTLPPTRSLGAPAMKFNGFSITWKSPDKSLLISQIKIEAKSSRLSGGVSKSSLDSTEIEALLGAPNATLAVLTDEEKAKLADPKTYPNFKGHIYSSTDTSKKKSAAGLTLNPCGLAIGGLSLADADHTSDFTASVTIKLYGSAIDSSGNETPVFKTITTSAQYYD